jgi:hypothetical protein
MNMTDDPLAILLAKDELQNLKARYCRFLDTKDWDGYAAVFTEDAVMDVREDTGLGPITGIEAIFAQVRAAVGPATICHQVHSPEFEFSGPDNAQGIWSMQDVVIWEDGNSPIDGVSAMTGYGQYHEQYRKVAGEWKIAALRLTRFHVDKRP